MKRMMTEMGIDLVLALTAIFVIYWAVRGFGIYQPPSKLREAVGEAWEKNGFSIAVVWPAHRDLSFVEGAEFALEENNATHNVLSQKIRLRMFTERWINQATRIAQRVAANSDVVAVIGHEFSSSALAASLIYETRGILYLAPQSTDPSLTTHGFQFVFRMTPDDRAMAAALVGFAKQQKFSKIAILYARTTLGESLGPRLVSELAKHGMELAFYHSYLPLEDWPRPDFRPMIADLMQKPFDAVMVVDQLPRAGVLISDLRRMGVKQPILGGNSLDSPELAEIAGQAAHGIYSVSASDTSTQTPENVAFRQGFRKRYGTDPGYSASQGYESVRLLIAAILESRSADPIVLATTLRVGKWKGIFGEFSFSRQGDIVGRNLSTKGINNGIFAAVPPGKEPVCCQP